MIATRKPLFHLGRCTATPGALEALEKANQNPAVFLERHVCGDWGDVCQEDAEANDLALKEGDRILSVYQTTIGTKLWCITEADRSSTCLLLPDEY